MSSLLELKNITKVYPGVTALNDVSMTFDAGEIHAIVGENGAGKSTLINVISGVVQAERGSAVFLGNEYKSMTPALSKALGIGVIHQEFQLVYSMSVADNVFLGDKVGGKYLVNDKDMHSRSAKIFEQLGVKIDTNTTVGDLSTSQQQIVEIAKAIAKDVSLLIMDEPSATLSLAEVKLMFRLVRQLKEKGITVIYISHRLDEVFEICDRVSVMRDGAYIITKDISEVNKYDLVNYMVGRELKETFPKRDIDIDKKRTALKCVALSGNGVRDVSFTLRKGEILGLIGLVGAGRTELAKVICGDVKAESGKIIVYGEEKVFKSPCDAINNGIGLIPEDRKGEGVFLNYPIDWNIIIMSIRRLSKYGYVLKNKAQEISNKYFNLLRIKAPNEKQIVRTLSGGNQQKVVVAKTLAAQTKILIFDEPTRGIDVGAKQEIYKLMNDIARNDSAILMISSDMEEILGMSDRIIVMHEGKITGEIQKEEFDQKKIMQLASGLN